MSRTPTTRLALSKPDPGTNEPYDVSIEHGSNLDKIDGAIGFTVVTSGTRPSGADAWAGRPIRETDTGLLYVRDGVGSAWRQILAEISAAGGYRPANVIDNRRAATVDPSYLAMVTADSVHRYALFTDGKQEWGSGSGARDTNLYRSAADELATDDAFRVAGDYAALKSTGINGQAVSSGTNTTTSASYANLAGTGATTSFSFTKRLASTKTRLRVFIAASFLASGGTTLAEFGVLVDGVDTAVCHAIGATGGYASAVGVAYLTGLAAGALTVQGRWRRSAGGGTATRDTNCWLTIDAQEVSV